MSQVDMDSQLQTLLGRCTQSQVVSCLTLNHLLVTSRRAKKIQFCLKMKERERRGRFQGQGVRKVYRGLYHSLPIPSYFRNKISAAGNSWLIMANNTTTQTLECVRLRCKDCFWLNCVTESRNQRTSKLQISIIIEFCLFLFFIFTRKCQWDHLKTCVISYHITWHLHRKPSE